MKSLFGRRMETRVETARCIPNSSPGTKRVLIKSFSKLLSTTTRFIYSVSVEVVSYLGRIAEISS